MTETVQLDGVEVSVFPILWAAGAIGAAVLAGLVVHFVVFRAAGLVARRTDSDLDERTLERFRAPSRLIIPLLAVQLVAPKAPMSEGISAFISHLVSLGFIAGFTWAAVRGVGLMARAITRRHRVDVSDNLVARRIHTQTRVLSLSCSIIIVVVGAAMALMTFPQVRQVGASLLASAGIAGLAVGLAARPLLANLIAGIQLAFTEPIRIDDVVIVEGEWGRVEELTATYVVIRIWDLRRLVVPLGYFLEQPFQNWTRTTADILGTVFLHMDYTVPVDRVREELKRIVENDPDWDKRVQGVQVTNTSPQGVEVRVLVSAADAGKAWDLRCRVREKLVAFLQREFPGALPRNRVELREPSPA